MQSNIEIGKRIEKLRTEKGLTQLELAKKLKIKRETVSQWENGSRDLKSGYIIALADALDSDCDYILRGVETKNIGIYKRTGLSDESIGELEKYVNISLLGYSNSQIASEMEKRCNKKDNLAVLAHNDIVEYNKYEAMQTIEIFNSMIQENLVASLARNIQRYLEQLELSEKCFNEAISEEWFSKAVDYQMKGDGEYKIARCFILDSQETLMKFIHNFCEDKEKRTEELRKEVISSLSKKAFDENKEGVANGNDN